MIVRVEKVVGGFAILLPSEVGQVHEHGRGHGDSQEKLPEYDAVYRELAKGAEGVGPHDPPPFDRRKL
jgi:hypothetical protein